jgi:hypothetical protein
MGSVGSGDSPDDRVAALRAYVEHQQEQRTQARVAVERLIMEELLKHDYQGDLGPVSYAIAERLLRENRLVIVPREMATDSIDLISRRRASGQS